ncbi:MAG TPA: hypothetical protein VEL28_19040 [Candidatus Binatia bacterium]|nr:hypothetical protein [Candidatus Binatia bacterium]
MPNVLIRGIDAEVLQALKGRAKAHNRSLQAELKVVLERAARGSASQFRQAAERLSATLPGPLGDSTELVREDRDR